LRDIKSIRWDRRQAYRAGDKAGAIDRFLRGVCWPGYRAVLDLALPDGFDQYVADADTFFDQELPACNSGRSRGARQEWLLAWLPNVEAFVLPDATHLLQVQNPRGMAEGLALFSPVTRSRHLR
jgi:hypothetical protein